MAKKNPQAQRQITKAIVIKAMRQAVDDAVNKLGPKTASEINEYRKSGICGICKRTSLKLLCRDHHHNSREFRGLLCVPCNLALGLIRDDPNMARAMTDYLEKPPVMSDHDMIDFNA